MQKVYEGEPPQAPIGRGDLIVWHDPTPGTTSNSHCSIATGVADSISQLGYSIEHWRLIRNPQRTPDEEARFEELEKSEPIHNVVSAGELHPLVSHPGWQPAGGKRFYNVYRVKDHTQLTCEHMRELLGEPPPAPVEKILIARWDGAITGRERHYATREPGAFGLALSGPNMVENVSVNVRLREELDPRSGTVDTVVERIEWKETVDDLYYELPDVGRVGAGRGGKLSVEYGEEDLRSTPPADADYLSQLRQHIAEARERLREAQEKRKQAADKALGLKRPERVLAGTEAFESGLNGFRQAVARHGADAEATFEAQRELNEALTALGNAFQAEMEAEQKKYMPLFERYSAVGNDPNASDADKRAAAEAMLALSQKMQESFAAVTALWDWPNAWFELALADAEVHGAREQLRDAEQQLARAQATEPRKATAKAGVRYDAATGKRIAFVEFGLSDPERLRLTNYVSPLKLEGFTTVVEDRVEPREMQSYIPILRGGFGGEAEVRGNAAVITYKDARQSGEPGLIGGGESEVSATFTRKPEPVRYRASVANVSEIPDWWHLAIKGPHPLSVASPPWLNDFPARDESHPLDGAFSDSRKFRFMHVLSAYIATPDGLTISEGDFLTVGPNGEQSAAGESIPSEFEITELEQKAASMKIAVDGVEVMIFEQVYGVNANPRYASEPLDVYPPLWTALRIGLAADGRRILECFDYSPFPLHFIYEDGAYRFVLIEDVAAWIQSAGPLEENEGYFMFDPAGAEAWWRGRAENANAGKASTKGNPWGIGERP